VSNPRILAGLILATLMLGAAGCQSAGGGAVLGSAAEQPPAEKIKESELRAYCPQVVLREGTAYFNTYQRDGQDDPKKLIYQASIADVTRSCTYNEGMLTMNVAVAGKVVPGPAGAPGNITMPIRVAVMKVTTDGEEVLYSQLHQYPVAVGDAATQFIFNDPNVTFPAPTTRNIRVFAGYDEGPERAATQ
jgi:hypothetical protein